MSTEQERKRSVPKKGIKMVPAGQTTAMSMLPYATNSGTTMWSSDFNSSNTLRGCVVLKFGGSSCGSKLPQVTEIVAKQASEGPVAVVVSAMGKSTDLLIDAADLACLAQYDAACEKVALIKTLSLRNIDTCIAHEHLLLPIHKQVDTLLTDLTQLLLGISLVRELSPASLDRLLSYGERLSAMILAYVLTTNGTPAVFIDGKNLIVTDEDFGKANVEWEETLVRIQHMEGCSEAVPVVTGFLGSTRDGRRTTLGRNGSDYTASLLGLGLNASKVVINTDVPGVFTADPSIVKEAYPVPLLSYVEAMELSIYGSRMFHPRTILPLVDQKIPMTIRNTDDPDGEATVISSSQHRASHQATCVTQLENMGVLTLRSRLGQGLDGNKGTRSHQQHIGLKCCAALDRVDVKIHHASFAANGQAVHVVISENQIADAQNVLKEEFEREIERKEFDEMHVWAPVTLLSLVRAPQMVLQKLFAGLTAARVRIRAVGQGSDSSSVSCVIDGHDTAVAVRCAHTAINLGHQIVSLMVLGNNPSSLNLLKRIDEKRGEMLERYKVELRVVGIFHTCGVTHHADLQSPAAPLELEEDGVGIAAKVAEMEKSECIKNATVTKGMRMSSILPIRLLQRLRQMSCPVVVDCNRLPLDLNDFYKACASHGINIVTSSAASIASLDESLPIEPESFLMYDTSVGASVPICDTIRRLNQMGDRVIQVEGVLSGTCNYICTLLNEGERDLSVAAQAAIANSYSEARIVNDLNGLDAANKLVALSRMMGYKLRLEDIDRRPLVSVACQEELENATRDEQIEILQKHDAAFAAHADSQEPGHTLAYLCGADFRGDTVQAWVKPQWVSSNHPSLLVKGIDIYMQIHREGYASGHPLLLQGPGCGSSSALGILGDILKTALKLQGTML